jgi:uncharacterized glyoxalase superfamily protein PhnB
VLSEVAVTYLPRNQEPKLSVSAPKGGEVWSKKQTIRWSGSDPDRDTLLYDVYYSRDDGATWTKLNRVVKEAPKEEAAGTKFRIAFFKPVGASAKTFDEAAGRTGSALGLTVDDVDAAYQSIAGLAGFSIELSGPPKEHPWGEKSFLLTDPDGNRWEVAQSPSASGMLENR